MSKRRNFNAAFKQFEKNLRISDEQNAALINARRAVRGHLRQHCPNGLGIKFLTQGSFAYGTLNRPNQTPPQRMDLDDGAYFATSTDNDPRVFFNWADNALQSLVGKHRGWRLDTSKPSCCRVIIPGDMHVDVPLYASMNESPDNLRAHRERYAPLYQEAGMFYAPLSGVWLAHRNDGWIKSDPGALIDWVLECKQKYGKQYLNVCRYFKAWRDHQWTESPLKSILIMAVVARAFEYDSIGNEKGGDDDAVFAVSGRMVDYLNHGGVTDPTIPSKRLDGDISTDERADIIAKLRNLSKDLDSALYGNTNKSHACRLMRRQFGKWFPENSETLISVMGPATVAVTTPSASVSAPRPWAPPWK